MLNISAAIGKGKGAWFFGTSGKASFIAATVLLALFCFIDNFLSVQLFTPYVKHLAFVILIYSVLSLSLNFVTGYIGQLSLGHAAFFGLGAYVSAILTMKFGWSFWLAFWASGLATGLIGVPLALPSLRVKGGFLVVITYGFGEVLRYVMINSKMTGGPAGMPGLITPSLFGKQFTRIGSTGKEVFIIMAFLLVVFLTFFMSRIQKSRTGYALSAIRHDEIAALSMGININYYKLLAFAMSAFFAGLAGSLYAHYARMVSPELLQSATSIIILSMVVVGGPRSLKGAILGAMILTLAPEVLRSLKDMLHLPFDPWFIIYGLLLIIMMRVRPQGIWGKADR